MAKGEMLDSREVLSTLIDAYMNDNIQPAKYLEMLGYHNPHDQWKKLKTRAKAKLPDLYEKLEEIGLITHKVQPEELDVPAEESVKFALDHEGRQDDD